MNTGLSAGPTYCHDAFEDFADSAPSRSSIASRSRKTPDCVRPRGFRHCVAQYHHHSLIDRICHCTDLDIELFPTAFAGYEEGATMPDDIQSVRAATFDEMLDAVLVADDARRYVDVNPAACDLFGRTRDELLSMRVEDLFPADSADVTVLWRQFLREGNQAGEFTIERRDGRKVVIEFRARERHSGTARERATRRDRACRLRACGGAGARGARRDHQGWHGHRGRSKSEAATSSVTLRILPSRGCARRG
jgi:PAS domain S-box-containing protein